MEDLKFESLKAFILAQPDERKVIMNENYFSDPCGCILIQYGREIFPAETVAIPGSGAGYSGFNVGENDFEFEDVEQVTSLVFEASRLAYYNKEISYKQIKELI